MAHNAIKLKVHPAADIFPMLDDTELTELAESIKKHGLREKIVVDTDGQVVDGRNRFAALTLAEIPLTDKHVTVMNFDKVPYAVEDYVIMANLQRRNLSRTQRKELAGKLAVMLGKKNEALPKEEQTDTTKKAAELAGVSRRTAAEAKQEALEKMGLPKTERPKPTKLTPAQVRKIKSKSAALRPPSVIKQLRMALDAIKANHEKWSAENAALGAGIAGMIIEALSPVKEDEEEEKENVVDLATKA